MIDSIESPAAIVSVRWMSQGEGGRRSGPPTAKVYAANCVFLFGDEAEVMPDWPAGAELFSLLLERIEESSSFEWRCKAAFLAPDLVLDFLRVGANMFVMEGPKVVGSAVVEEVLV